MENSGHGADRFNEIKALQQTAFALKSDAAVGFFLNRNNLKKIKKKPRVSL